MAQNNVPYNLNLKKNNTTGCPWLIPAIQLLGGSEQEDYGLKTTSANSL
jgi:hypothetical protein